MPDHYLELLKFLSAHDWSTWLLKAYKAPLSNDLYTIGEQVVAVIGCRLLNQPNNFKVRGP